jgi:hypothetical protein
MGRVVAMCLMLLSPNFISVVYSEPPDRPDRDSRYNPQEEPQNPEQPRVIQSTSALDLSAGVSPAITTIHMPSKGGNSRDISTSDPECGVKSSNAKCADVCVSGIPIGSSITAVNAYAREINGNWVRAWRHPSGFYDVLPYSRFYPGQTTTTAQEKIKVCWQYRNWSHNLAREARLEVVYTPPRP